MHRFIASVVLAWLGASGVHAHYHILLPESPSAERDKPVNFTLRFGHPYEHELFDVTPPESLVVVLPDGKARDLTKTLTKEMEKTSEQKPVVVYRFQYVPEQRGDSVFVLKTVPVWMETEQHFIKDTVRVTLHVLTQKGWDNALRKGFEMVPLTRPYGLQAGMVFQAEASFEAQPASRALVEIERMNAAPPKNLPHDDHITRRVKADSNGVATCTLTEPGWWCVTALRDAGKLAHRGNMYPVQERSTLWVYVDEDGRAKKGN